MSTPRNAFEWSKLYFRNEDRSLLETKATMAALFTYADFDDLTCFPSQKTLARITGASVDTVRRHLKKNIGAGWLRKLKQGSSYKSSTEYLLTTPCTDTGSATQRPGTQPPARMQGVRSTPGTDARSTPSTVAGSTPCTDAPLTTHTTTQGTTHQGGSIEKEIPDPCRSGITHPPDATKNVPTPSTGAGSSGSTGAGSAWCDNPFPNNTAPPAGAPLVDQPRLADGALLDPFAAYALEKRE